MSLTLVLLGTGAGNGVPAFYCGCRACQEAQRDPRWRRTRSAVLLEGQDHTLVDATPDLREQLLREQVAGPARLFLTHWHYDHFGGLGELEYFVRLRRLEPLPVYTAAHTWQALVACYGFMADCLEFRAVVPGKALSFGECRVIPLAAAHETAALGLLIEGQRRVAYLPDTGPLPAETRGLLRGVDLLVLGATFWRANWFPATHLTVEEAIEEGRSVGANEIILTHLAMHYAEPVTAEELEAYLAAFGNVRLAYDGMRVPV